MDIQQIKDTNDLLQIIPKHEDKDWEFKSAQVFDKANFGEFKKQKLGKIVSSFTNSGGGHLLLGKKDDEEVFEAVPTHQGRATMEDHLSLMIANSVEPQCRDFEIHRVPIAGTSADSVLVVAFDDSLTAPHQSVSDTTYYYRLPGHTQKAPHFHLESLRGRNTRAVIAIEKPPKFSLSFPLVPPKAWREQLVFQVELEIELCNKSLARSADHFALKIFGGEAMKHWYVAGKRLHPGTQVSGTDTPLLPSSTTLMTVQLHLPLGEPNPLMWRAHLPAWENLEVVVQPLSQDFVGEPLALHPFKSFGNEALIEYQRAIDAHFQSRQRLQETCERSAIRIAKAMEGLELRLGDFGRGN